MWLINIAFLQLPVRGHNCHSGHYHINQFLRHEREARSLCAQEIQENVFSPLSSTLLQWKACVLPHNLICWKQHSCVSGFPSFICFNWINDNSSSDQILHIIWTCQYCVSFRTELSQSRTSPFQHQKIDLTCEWVWRKNHIIWFLVNNLKNTQWNIKLFNYYEIIIKSFSILHTLFNCVLPAIYFANFAIFFPRCLIYA